LYFLINYVDLSLFELKIYLNKKRDCQTFKTHLILLAKIYIFEELYKPNTNRLR